MDSELSTEIKPMSSGYAFTISPHIYSRLERHILILKKLIDRSTTKQRWLSNAIKEKLARDENNQQLPKATYLSVKIEKDTEKEIGKKIEFAKKFRFSYSKKQWIVDAILEKLDQEETEDKSKLLDLTQSQRDTYKQQNESLQTEIESLKLQLQAAQNALVASASASEV